MFKKWYTVPQSSTVARLRFTKINWSTTPSPPDPTLPWKALSLTFFLAGIALAAGVASSGGGGGGGSDDDAAAPASSSAFPTLALDSKTVHWGYFSKYLQPVMTVASGDTVTVEMATHHACDDCASPRPAAARTP